MIGSQAATTASGDGVVLVDTHCHLDMRAFAGESTAAVLARAAEAGVARVVTIGIDVSSSRAAVALAEAHPGVYATVGVNPGDLDGFGDLTLRELAELAACPKVVAVGEIGLDYHWNASPRDVQLAGFQAQLDLARRLGLPVVVHDRDAHDDTVATLLEWAAQGQWSDRPLGVLHCFSGDLAMAERMAAAGFLVSLAGNVTYAENAALHEVARQSDLSALVVETDSPYLSPEPYRRRRDAERRNEPARVRLTAAYVAELRAMELADLAAATTANAARLFRWCALAADSSEGRRSQTEGTPGADGRPVARGRDHRASTCDASQVQKTLVQAARTSA